MKQSLGDALLNNKILLIFSGHSSKFQWLKLYLTQNWLDKTKESGTLPMFVPVSFLVMYLARIINVISKVVNDLKCYLQKKKYFWNNVEGIAIS